jgi:hypothetical protein
MVRGAPFFLALSLALPSAGWSQAPATDDKQKSSTDSPPQASGKEEQKAKTGDSSVFVLKSPEPPPSQPTLAPQLRAVDLEKRDKLGPQTKMHLITLLDAEFAHVRKSLPLGDKSLSIDPQGRVTPSDQNLFQLAQVHGIAAKPGDKVQITNVTFREKSIFFAINGGPKKHGHWYDHVSIGVGGSGGEISPTDSSKNQPVGAGLTLEFNKQIPEMTGDELKKLLSPVLDFSSKSAAEVFSESMPPKVKEAIKNHQVLVGMNRDMVIMAKDRPEQKVREKDESGKDYEDWIYGKPPQEMTFVRFVGDEVTLVKIAKVGGQLVFKTEKEVDVKDGTVSLAALKASNSPQDVSQQPDQPQQPAKRPTLKREGEEGGPDPALKAPVPGGQAQLPPKPDEPEWGTKDKRPAQDPPQAPQQDTPKPPQ